MVACDDTRNADVPQRVPGQQQADRETEPALPRSGYRFLSVIVGAVYSHAGPLAETLDAPT